jgi:flagellar protein FliL
MTELSPEALAILSGAGAPPKRSGWIATAGTVAALTLVAAGGGWALGTMLGAKEAVPPVAEATPVPAAEPTPAETVQSAIVPLAPVTADISSPPGTQLRLRASLVMKAGSTADTALIAAQVQADTVVFARSLELAQVEGSRGLLHLREDLLERAKLRSADVEDILIDTLVVK